MSVNKLSKEMLDFLFEQRGSYSIILNHSTELENDLKITGDDAYDFMVAYSNRFNVKISKINLSEYFVSENSLSMYGLVLFGIKTNRKVINLGHLEKGIQASRLDEEILNY
jgi:acyl carrier protein